MNAIAAGVLTVLGRIMLCAIFVLSAVGNKIPEFSATAKTMGSVGMPFPQVMLAGAILFLLVGSLLVVTGLYARVGAAMLLLFLALATYYFHNFWEVADPAAQQAQMIQALKNLSMAGAMLMIIGSGPGKMSFRLPGTSA